MKYWSNLNVVFDVRRRLVYQIRISLVDGIWRRSPHKGRRHNHIVQGRVKLRAQVTYGFDIANSSRVNRALVDGGVCVHEWLLLLHRNQLKENY